MGASKSEIKSLQGLSVLAMLCLHLFCRTDFSALYTPIIYLFGKPLCYYFAQLSDFCVMGFAFCSGYAHSILYETDKNYYKNRIKGVIRLLSNYWIILLVFCIISIIIGNGSSMPGSISTFIGNFFIYKMTYNGAWWYLTTYIFLVLTSKFVIPIIKRVNSFISIPVLIVIYSLSYFIRFNYQTSNILIIQLYLYGMTVVEYAIGVYFYKHKIFTLTKSILNSKPLIYILSLVTFIAMLLTRTLVVPSLFVAPATGIAIILIFHLLYKGNFVFKLLYHIGNHSTNMWLTHMFFYLGVFSGFIWIFKYPTIIFLLMVLITIAVSIILKVIQKPLEALINNFI